MYVTLLYVSSFINKHKLNGYINDEIKTLFTYVCMRCRENAN